MRRAVLCLGFLVMAACEPAQSVLAQIPAPFQASSSDEPLSAADNARIRDRAYAKAIVLYKASLAAGADGELRQQAMYGLAEAQWANGDIDGTILTFTVLLQTNEKSDLLASALWRLAMAYMSKAEAKSDMGLYAQGQSLYARFVQDYPAHPLAPNALLVQGNFAVLIEANRQKAIRIYEQVAEKFPDTDEAHIALSWLPGLRAMSDQQIQQQAAEERRKSREPRKPAPPTSPQAKSSK